ncbi:MAG: T9SS type A sorting domain-containing protein [Ignavibacteria bacterium]|nr:T9SS type A sorting domain-containing protein [Ignavibacteria bacterium]
MTKKFNLSLAILMSMIFCSQLIYAQGFNSITSPDGVNVIAVGDAGLIFKSQNGGNSWASYTIPSVNFKSVASYNNSVWMSASNGKVYKTLKSNSPVNAIELGLTSSLNSIAFTSETVGYVCGDSGVVYKTINGGNNWTSASTGIPVSVSLTAISFLDESKGIAAGKDGKVYTTVNGGAQWTAEATGATRNIKDVKYFADGMVVTGEYGTLFIKEGTSNWTQVNTRIQTDVNAVSGTSISDVHVCGGGGFIRNNKNNDARFYNFEINPMLGNLVDLHYYNADLGFAVSSLNNAIIRTTNGGVLWTLTAGATVSHQWQLKLSATGGIGNNLSSHPTDPNTVFCGYGNRVYVSRNRGENWTQIATATGMGSNMHSFYVSPLDTNVWVAAITGSPDRVIKTTNYGANWTISYQQNFSNYGQPLEMDQNNPSVFYFAPDGGGFYKSTDNGSTFTEISGNYAFRSPCDILVMWDSSNVVFVGDGVTGSGQAIIFKSTNGGVNWTNIRTVTSSETPSMCNSVFDQSLIYATEWSGSNIYLSTDYGSSFSISHSTGFSGWASGICSEDPTLIMTGNYGANSAFSLNKGNTWTNLGGLGGSGAGMLVPDRGMLLSMQTSNLYKMKSTYSVLTSINETQISSSVPSGFDLSQNYPNPFNPSTLIKYSLPTEGNVTLKVYDQLGREVSTLSEGFKTAGVYEATFDASKLSSGVYFYKLASSGFEMTKKMLLVK